MRRFFPLSQKVLLVLLSIGILKTFVDTGILLWHYSAHSVNPDNMVYFTVGRGILNGFVPYRDLFEMKPPGIFLVSALSMWWNGSEDIAHLLQLCVFFSFPLGFTWFAWTHTTHLAKQERYVPLGVALLMGLMTMLYVAHRVYSIQAEEFGTFFCLLFAMALTWKGPMSWKKVVVLTIGVFGSIGFKEPFALTLLAASLLMMKRPKDLVKTWIIPTLVAGIVGVAIMAALGWLEPYLHINLPYIFGTRLYTGAAGVDTANTPLWVRGLFIHKLFLDWSQAPYIFFSLLLAICTAYWLKDNEERMPRGNTLYWRIALLCVALYFTAIAVGLGNYFSSHFTFALPLLCVLLLTAVRHIAESPASPRLLSLLCVTLCLNAVAYYPPGNFALLDGNVEFNYDSSKNVVQRFDQLMAACEDPRYVIFGYGFPIMAYSRYTPMGPIFQALPYGGPDEPLTLQTYENGLKSADIILARDDTRGPLRERTTQIANAGFTLLPPDCAKPFFPIDGFILLFQKKSFPTNAAWKEEDAKGGPFVDFPDNRYSNSNPTDEFRPSQMYIGITPEDGNLGNLVPRTEFSRQEKRVIAVALFYPVLRDVSVTLTWYPVGKPKEFIEQSTTLLKSGSTYVVGGMDLSAAPAPGRYVVDIETTQLRGSNEIRNAHNYLEFILR